MLIISESFLKLESSSHVHVTIVNIFVKLQPRFLFYKDLLFVQKVCIWVEELCNNTANGAFLFYIHVNSSSPECDRCTFFFFLLSMNSPCFISAWQIYSVTLCEFFSMLHGNMLLLKCTVRLICQRSSCSCTQVSFGNRWRAMQQFCHCNISFLHHSF